MIVKLFITISATGFNCPRLELRFTKIWHYRARSVLALWSFSCNPERIIWVLKFQVLRRGNTEVYGKNRRKESGERTTHSNRIWRWQWVTNVNHISGKASAFYFWSTNLIIMIVKSFQSKKIKDNPKNKSGSVFFVKKWAGFSVVEIKDCDFSL